MSETRSLISTDELIVNTMAVQERVKAACERVGRSPEEVTLVAVTKTFPVDLIQTARAAGLADFGENRVQELVAKSAVFPGEVLSGDVRWHQIGPVQRNKAKDVARCADVFHALESVRLAERLNRLCAESRRVLPCLVQVNVSGEQTKSGVIPDDLGTLLEQLVQFEHLRIVGLMTLAAPARHPAELESVVRPQFSLLRQLADHHNGLHGGIKLTQLSMGMSGDFEFAIEEGATHIRLGSVLFGRRG